MNKKLILYKLSEQLADFIVHKDFTQELIKIIAETGVENRFFSTFSTRLRALKEYGEKVVLLQPEHFESIKGVENIYSMHIVSRQLNLRILFSFSQSDDILLHTFFERSGKKNTSYISHLPVATERLKQILSK